MSEQVSDKAKDKGNYKPPLSKFTFNFSEDYIIQVDKRPVQLEDGTTVYKFVETDSNGLSRIVE